MYGYYLKFILLECCDVFREDIPELLLAGMGDKFMTVWDELWNKHDSVSYVGRFAYSMRAYIYGDVIGGN